MLTCAPGTQSTKSLDEMSASYCNCSVLIDVVVVQLSFLYVVCVFVWECVSVCVWAGMCAHMLLISYRQMVLWKKKIYKLIFF